MMPIINHGGSMNIFTKIKKDHDEARDIMDEILETPEAEERLELFSQLKIAILSHAKSEEKTFYEALKESDELAEEVPYLKHEHKDAENLFNEIDELDADDTMWWEKFGEVRKALMHHMEEEEKKIFKDAKEEIPSDEAKELGERMDELEEKEKDKLMDEEPMAA
jgi:hemerythrin superfamily protein